MSFVAVDKDGTEFIYTAEPYRDHIDGEWNPDYTNHNCVMLPPGTIRKLLGYDLTWNDEPVQLT